ncbi:MAG: hypothetical protein U0871_08460 [Gemmataceae bacterium]
MRAARLVSWSAIRCRSSTSSGVAASSGSLAAWSPSARTRSTTRPSRLEVARLRVPDAEMSTAGVIIAPRTDAAGGRSNAIGGGGPFSL